MIGLGAKYLTAAGFGRYRITAASLGSLDLLGTWHWLNGATKQAIMDAFGVDGTAVIRATNEYLNGIAASDMAKAIALASYINEDPMMVCSLGLEPQGVTMPIRWLYNGGVAYIDTGIVFRDAFGVHCRYKFNTLRNDRWLGLFNNYRGRNENQVVFGCYNSKVLIDIAYGTTDYMLTPNILADTLPHDIWVNYPNIGFKHDNVVIDSNIYIGVFNNSYSSYLFSRNGTLGPSVSTCDACLDLVKFVDLNNVEIANFLPFIRQGANGMIDVVTGTFYPNANSSGSFTIEYTLPDGTPWTPPTP